MSEQCERTSEQGSKWPSAQRVNFISYQPRVDCSSFKEEECCLRNHLPHIIVPSIPFQFREKNTIDNKDKMQ